MMAPACGVGFLTRHSTEGGGGRPTQPKDAPNYACEWTNSVQVHRRRSESQPWGARIMRAMSRSYDLPGWILLIMAKIFGGEHSP